MKSETKRKNESLIVEWANHDSPCRLQYAPLEDLSAPENGTVLVVDSHRLILYGSIPALDRVEEFAELNLPKSMTSGRGFELTDIRGIFAMPRSIVTEDGRIYVNECHFTPQFSYYIKHVPIILEDCADFYLGKINDLELSNLERRIF